MQERMFILPGSWKKVQTKTLGGMEKGCVRQQQQRGTGQHLQDYTAQAPARFLATPELRHRQKENTQCYKYSGLMPGGGNHGADDTGHGGANNIQ
jgi:hypothetical protein